MKGLLIVLATIALLAGCNSTDTCINIEREGYSVKCEKCFENDADYAQWFDRCAVYAFVEGNAAVDSLCNCE